MWLTDSDDIRTFIFRSYIEPGRQRGAEVIQFAVEDVCERMGLIGATNRVWNALNTPKLERDFGAKTLERSGPDTDGKTVFTMRIADSRHHSGEATACAGCR